jgi:hypothetical protein
MKAVMPTELCREAVKNDTLRIGRFMRPGSPAPDKEPFYAFHRSKEPNTVSAIRYGAELKIISPSLPEYDGRKVKIDTRVHDVRSMKGNLPTLVMFLDTEETMTLEDLPRSPDFRLKLVKVGE